MTEQYTSVRTRIKNWIRRRLLADEERRLVERVNELENELDEIQSEWRGIKEALQEADVWGEPTELDSVDILILAGRQQTVQSAGFDGPIYISSAENAIISDCVISPEDTDTERNGDPK